MLNSQEVQTVSTIVRSLLNEHNMTYRVTPFDDKLYQDCIDEALRHGYPIEGDMSFKKSMPIGVLYAATASGCHASRPTRIWLALYTAATFFVDDIPSRFPSEIPNLYLFVDQFIKGEKQGNAVLQALADILRWGSDFFPPILFNMITTSCANFVTFTLVEHETTSMKISSDAEQYPAFQRHESGVTDAYALIIFPREMPFTEFIQALPEIMDFITEANDVLSFYKEELDGEMTNQISTIAARNNESKLVVLEQMAKGVTNHYKSAVKILGESSVACNAFENFVTGYFDFHFSEERYRLADLAL